MLESSFKTCTKCKVPKSLDEFHKDRHSKDGHVNRCKLCACTNTRSHRAAKLKKNPDHFTDFDLRKFGLTLSDYQRMAESQNNRCAICGTDKPATNKKRFCVDHDHVTNKVRGLLCAHCNMGIGQLGDDPARLSAAAEYLRKYKDDDRTAEHRPLATPDVLQLAG